MARPVGDFMLLFGVIINKTVSIGIPMPRLAIDQALPVKNVTFTTMDGLVKMCVQLVDF
jgi:hypothetical protein